MKILTKETYTQRTPVKLVELDEGHGVYIRALPASVIVNGAKDDAGGFFEPANLLVKSLCDENGTLLFDENEKNKTLEIDHGALKKILNAVMEINGLTGENTPEKN